MDGWKLKRQIWLMVNFVKMAVFRVPFSHISCAILMECRQFNEIHHVGGFEDIFGIENFSNFLQKSLESFHFSFTILQFYKAMTNPPHCQQIFSK